MNCPKQQTSTHFVTLLFQFQCELYHWIDVLDRFDDILGTVAKPVQDHQWIFQFDMLKDLLGSHKGVKKICFAHPKISLIEKLFCVSV